MKILSTLALLMVISTTVYAQSPSRAGNTKWEVQGWSGDTVLLVGDNGETRTAIVGDLMDGCLVSAKKFVCDPAEKMAIENESRSAKEKEAALKAAAQTRLKEETDTRIAIEAKVKVLSSETAEQQKQIAVLKDQIEKLSNEKAESQLLADKSREAVNGERFVKLVDKMGAKSFAEELGVIRWISLDDEVILQIEAARKKQADTYLQPAVRQTIVNQDHVYYILEKNLIDIREHI